MSTIQFLCNTEMMQPEQQNILIKRMPVQEDEKISAEKITINSTKNNSWENIIGLDLGFEEDKF